MGDIKTLGILNLKMGSKKIRLDQALLKKGLAVSRERAKALIMAGKVFVNGHRSDKPGTPVSPDDDIEVRGEDMPYVSRGGLKLEAALTAFQVDVTDRTCMDVGASTGGFTDCLLQNGARRVYAIDVGYGQLAWKLRNDPRVIVIERTNIRHMPEDAVPEAASLATVDVSFISLKIVVPAMLKFLDEKAVIIALIKPQFEVGRENVGKGGVVKDPALHEESVSVLSDFFENLGLDCGAAMPSPILGPKGNKEFLIRLSRKF